jgi:hypothetical protein
LHAGHLNARASKPTGPVVVCANTVPVWHIGQSGRRMIMMLSPLVQAGALQDSQSPVDTEGGGDQPAWNVSRSHRWSILLTSGKLIIRSGLQLAGNATTGRHRIHRISGTTLVKLRLQFLHSNVRTSRRSGPVAIATSFMRPSHIGHPGRRIGSRQGSGRVCSAGMMHSPAFASGCRD